MRKLRPRKIRSLPKVTQLESDRAKIPNQLPRQSGSRAQITPGVTPTAPTVRQTLWVIRQKNHSRGVFLWALHGHSCAGQKGALSRLAGGCKACHPGVAPGVSAPLGTPISQCTSRTPPSSPLPWVLPLGWEGQRIWNNPMTKGARELCK